MIVVFTGISVYNVVVLCLIGVPIALMMKEAVDAAYALNSLFIFFATSLTISLVFIPKVKRIECIHTSNRLQDLKDNKFTFLKLSTASPNINVINFHTIQIVHRNKEPHSGTMWNKTVDSSGTGTKKTILSTAMTEYDRREVEGLRDDNRGLKAALEQVSPLLLLALLLMKHILS